MIFGVTIRMAVTAMRIVITEARVAFGDIPENKQSSQYEPSNRQTGL
jgi:hypothetical protein